MVAPKTVTLFSSTLGDVNYPNPQAGGAGAAASIGFSGDIQSVGQTNPQISLTGIQPGSINNNNVLAVFTLPANFFDQAGRGLNIVAMGSTASNTNTKTLQIVFNATTAVVGSAVTGGTAIASLTLATAAGSGGWTLEANVFKAGAAGSNTQVALHVAGQGGNVVGTLVGPTTNLAAVESGPIIIAITGNGVTATTDVTFNFLEIFAMN